MPDQVPVHQAVLRPLDDERPALQSQCWLFGSFERAMCIPQYRVVEARVDDLQTHGVFPMHPAAHGLGSLAVRQALGTWQHCREDESLGRSSGLAALGNKRANC